ncbi:MAG: 1-acyl-sn-glycerol-3-phosphate acyltransferase [Lachnospiraceae bacterium]|nr:1-acyl-sn-glycerol-3-phosphate acyltransferase [Lachnospiraceae bacterium]
MLYILSALALLSAIGTHLLFKWYTSPWHILVFVGVLLGWVIIWELLWWLFIFINSLFVDKKKEVTKPSLYYRWFFLETIRIAFFFLNVHIHVEGMEKLPKPGERFLVVSNHLSNYDPMSVLYVLRKHLLVFVSKPENFNIPMVGSLIHKLGFMAIDRDNVKNALVTINKAADYIKNDVSSVFIFPEGTRNRTQTPLLEFRNGAFKIATKAGCPMVVIAISGTEKVKKTIPRRSDVYLKIVEVIPAETVKSMRTTDLSEHTFKLIYDNITHGKENLEKDENK